MKRALWVAVVLMGCGVQTARTDDGLDDETQVVGPLLGGDGHDAADRSCAVALRAVTRGANDCSSGKCWWTFDGVVDVSAQAAAEGAVPAVLYKNGDASGWSVATAVVASGAPSGFVRYAFTLSRDTIGDGMSATAYARASVQLAPYLLTASGARLFDHNRLPGDFDTYALSQAGGWGVGEAPGVCVGDAVVGRALSFQAGFQTSQRGTLVAGEAVTLTYALERLTDCRGTHNGYPAWDLTAYVKANPSGDVQSGTVRGFDAPNGVPSNAGAKSVPLDVTLPAGTTSIEVWFRNWSGAGSSCEVYDSNYGRNYVFPVAAAAPARPVWAGNPGSSFSRECARREGAPAVETLDSYVQQRACAFVEVEVYVPGLTDAAEGPGGALFAQVESSLDGVAQPAVDATFVGRFGNNWRYHYELPKSGLYYGPKWQTFDYGFRFSSDGRAWLRETTRALVRDPSFCNPAWSSCN